MAGTRTLMGTLPSRNAVGAGRALLNIWMFWVIAGALLLYAALFSVNALLWIACALSLPLVVWLMDPQKSYPVLLWIVGMYWIQIAADVLGADINGVVFDKGALGSYQVEAVAISLLAMFALAAGMRVGVWWPFKTKRGTAQQSARNSFVISLNKAAIGYLIAAVIAGVLAAIANMVPAIRQPLLGFVLLKYVFLYLLAAATFELGRNYQWLVLAIIFETVIGVTGFIASYHAAFIIVLIAAAAHARHRISLRSVLALGIGVATLVWISIVWTAIKPDYRFWANGGTNEQIVVRPLSERIYWISDRVMSGHIDYAVGAQNLVKRIGYTDFYAMTLARLDQELVPTDLNLWWSAVLHVVRPRVLFPDKQELDDTTTTSLLTGETFGSDTSVSVGYVAEAHADFGFPGLLVPIFVVGLMLGAIAKYFMTRPMPLVIREAFTTGCLFLSFSYAHNIDKELGGFITGFLALYLAQRYGYPLISKWLSGPKRSRSGVGQFSI